MTIAAIVWLLAVAIFCLALRLRGWWSERRRLVRIVNQIPGPLALPIIGSVFEFKLDIEGFASQLLQFAEDIEKAGSPIARIWLGPFPVVCTFSSESIKAVLDNQDVISKGSEYGILINWLGTGLLTSSGEKWRTRRKMLTPAFHFNVLNSFLITHNKEARIFVDQIAKYADSNELFNIYPYLKRLALDVICETSMGAKVDAQNNHNHHYVNAVKRMNELSFLYMRMPWFWLRPIWWLSGYEAEYVHNLDVVTQFTRKVIADRRKEFINHPIETTLESNDYGKKHRYALLDLLLSHGDQLTDEDIREEVDTFMFEGHDTTSSGMAWSLWCLAHHPDCQRKVLEEVDEIFGNSDRQCNSDDLKRLKYLEQCIKEALRLYPPVPLFTRMVENDFDCVGYTVPRGATVLVSPLVAHRNKQEFRNPSKFDPEHFSAESVANRHAYAYIPFSAGPRNCIGQKFALMEEKTVLSWFFRNYTIRAQMELDENVPCPEIILKPSKGTPAKILRREKSHAHMNKSMSYFKV